MCWYLLKTNITPPKYIQTGIKWIRKNINGNIENTAGAPDVAAPPINVAINNESNKNQARANGNIGLKIPSKIKQRLLGFPFQRIFSLLPTINSNSDFA